MTSVELYNVLFRALLNRTLSANEEALLHARYGHLEVDPWSVGKEILDSDEFFHLHRENLNYKLFSKSTPVISRGPMGHELITDLRQFHLGHAIATGNFEPGETAFVTRTVKRGWTVLDVGANVGYFSTIFAGLVGESGRVLAFEPVTETYSKLIAAIQRNGLQGIITPYNLAASDNDGECTIMYSSHSTNMGGVSISTEKSSENAEIKETARTAKIDDVIGVRPVHFIKMDVEGAEKLVIDGAKETLKNSKPIMMVEFNSQQLKKVSSTTANSLLNSIISIGYDGFEIDQLGNTRPIDANTLPEHEDFVVNLAFLPPEHLP